MELRCLLIDDERPALDLMESFIRRTPGLHLCASFTDPEKAQASASRMEFDVAFLDVDMPGINGLELAARLPSASKIVFTTAYREYAADAYEQAAVDYLLKPFLYQRFIKCIERLTISFSESPVYLFVKDVQNGEIIRVSFEEIIYISAALNYVELHLSQKIVKVYSGLDHLLKGMPNSFVKIHRSYVINIQFVQSLKQEIIIMKNNTYLPISRKYLTATKKQLVNYM